MLICYRGATWRIDMQLETLFISFFDHSAAVALKTGAGLLRGIIMYTTAQRPRKCVIKRGRRL